MLFAVGNAMVKTTEPVAAEPVMLAFRVSVVEVAPHPAS